MTKPLPDLLPRRRGFCAVGLVAPKTAANIGGVLRAAFCFDAAFVAVSGTRYQRSATDTPNFPRHRPLFVCDDVLSLCPHDCEPVAVDIVEHARPLEEFRHLSRAYYIFGPEDGTLSEAIIGRCARAIVIPSRTCLNLAAAVNVVLYDRLAKQRREARRAPQVEA